VTTPAAEIARAPVIHLPEIGSTNEQALDRARRGESGPLFIRADRQTSGRGRHGRAWASPVGNLHLSLLMPIAAPPRCLPQVAHVAAVALARAIRAIAGPRLPLCVKWPNDLLIDRAKVAGILVEGTRIGPEQACVIGWGVNCAHHPADLPYAATNLSAALGRPVTADVVAAALRPAIAEAMTLWNDGRGFAGVRAQWLGFALPLETPMRVRGGGDPIAGRFQGIDEAGRLLLLGPHGPMTVEAGEVILDERSAALAG
jgi:BirA family transcriptional regulator, biotin operon repressor / biotin---[acetyl-CoA-carboxylase] ligase